MLIFRATEYLFHFSVTPNKIVSQKNREFLLSSHNVKYCSRNSKLFLRKLDFLSFFFHSPRLLSSRHCKNWDVNQNNKNILINKHFFPSGIQFYFKRHFLKVSYYNKKKRHECTIKDGSFEDVITLNKHDLPSFDILGRFGN